MVYSSARKLILSSETANLSELSQQSFIHAEGTPEHFITFLLKEMDPAVIGIRVGNEKWQDADLSPIPTVHIAIQRDHNREDLLNNLGLSEDKTKRHNVENGNEGGINPSFSYLRFPSEITPLVEIIAKKAT